MPATCSIVPAAPPIISRHRLRTSRRPAFSQWWRGSARSVADRQRRADTSAASRNSCSTLSSQFQEKGPNYIDALLQGYRRQGTPAGFTLPEGSYYNHIYPGHAIKMPKPLSDGQVTFDDGSPATLEQYSKDVAAFLMWTAEPRLEVRKRTGLQVMIFLLIFSIMLYFTKKKVWANAH